MNQIIELNGARYERRPCTCDMIVGCVACDLPDCKLCTSPDFYYKKIGSKAITQTLKEVLNVDKEN